MDLCEKFMNVRRSASRNSRTSAQLECEVCVCEFVGSGLGRSGAGWQQHCTRSLAVWQQLCNKIDL